MLKGQIISLGLKSEGKGNIFAPLCVPERMIAMTILCGDVRCEEEKDQSIYDT